MRQIPLVLASLVVLAACGKKESPTPPPATTPPAATTTAPAPPVATTTAPTTATTEADVAAPAPAPSSDGTVHLVWSPSESGFETAWIVADGDGAKVVATRAQATVFADGTLWGVEWRYAPFRETSCEDFERAEVEEGFVGKPGPKRYLPWVVARGLAGPKAGQDFVLAPAKSDYFSEEVDAKGDHHMIGEHWGRTIGLEGGAGPVLFVTDCEGSYGCGAHGDSGCGFTTFGLSGAEVTVDLPGAAKAIEAETRAMLAEWTGGDDDEVDEAELTAVSLVLVGGEPKVRYRFVASVPYSGTSGDWGSYTQSRDHIGPMVKALGVAEMPAVVKAYLAAKPGAPPTKEGETPREGFGWSVVPADAAVAMRAAFDDKATLPGPKPEDEKAAAPADGADGADKAGDAKSKLEAGRKLTREKKYAEAIASFDAALAIDDDLARAWSGRGYAKLASGDLDGARVDFETALGLDKTPAFKGAVYFNLGEIAEKQKNLDQARTWYKEALEIAPSDAVKKRLDKLGAP